MLENKEKILQQLIEEKRQMSIEMKISDNSSKFDVSLYNYNYLIRLPRKILRRMIVEQLTKEEIRYMWGLLSEVNNRTGEIKNISAYSLVNLINEKYMGNCSSSSFFSVHNRLIEKGFINYENRCLKVIDYEETFEKNSLGSTPLPFFVFIMNKNFSTAAYRLLMMIMDRIGVIHYRKAEKLIIDESMISSLRKRCPEEVRAVIDELRVVFDVEGNDLEYNFSLKDSYIIKETEIKGDKLPAKITSKRAWKNIIACVNSCGLFEILNMNAGQRRLKHLSKQLDLNEALKTIAAQLKDYNYKDIRYVLEILKNSIYKVRDVGAFLYTIIHIHIKKRPYEELEKSKIEKLIRELMNQGASEDDIENWIPGIYEKYQYLCTSF